MFTKIIFALMTFIVVSAGAYGFDTSYKLLSVKTYDIPVYGEVNNLMVENIKTILEKVHDGDTLVLHIDSGGGDLYSAISIINSLKTKKVYIISKVERYSASAATLITFTANRVETSKFAIFIFHVVRITDALGKENICGSNDTSKECTSFGYPYSVKLLTALLTAYPNLLNALEIEKYKLGEDILITGHDLMTRTQRVTSLEKA